MKLELPSGSSPLGMAVVMGRVLGDDSGAKDVILPTATEVILDFGSGFRGSSFGGPICW